MGTNMKITSRNFGFEIRCFKCGSILGINEEVLKEVKNGFDVLCSQCFEKEKYEKD
jgi:hypothetical protein